MATLENLKNLSDLTHLEAIQACARMGRWDLVKRWEAAYKLSKMKFEKPRLEGYGKPESILFIGTNPSIRSSLQKVWEDPYGKYFGAFLKEAGIDPEEVYTTNLYKHPTPDNRPLDEREIAFGWPELKLEIEFNDPTVIVSLGIQAHEKLNKEKILSKKLYHPSYVKRFPDKKVEFINQLKKIKQIHDEKRIRKESLGQRSN